MTDLGTRARQGGVAERVAIAGAEDAPAELLTWLTADPTSAVRLAGACNRATPPQAGLVLAEDADRTVRCGLARRIASIAPGLDPASRDRLARITLATLARLAEDAVVEGCAIVAEAVAGLPGAPRALVLRLAHDTAIEVAGPVLGLSPLLSERDLLALVAAPPAAFTRSRIATRANLPEAVAEAVAASADSPAIAALLGNPSAAIREATLDRLVAGAAGEESWQAALVRRPRLPPGVLRALGAMLAGQLLDVLAARPDLPAGLAESLRAMVTELIEAPEHLALRRAAAAGDRAFVLAALAEATGHSPIRLEAALALRSARVVAALCWKAGWPAPLAMALQPLLGISPGRVIGANAEGGWTLGEDEMLWQLELMEDFPG